MLRAKYIKTISAVSAALLLSTSSISFAKDTSTRDIHSFTCKEVMRMTGGDREISVSFLHGYWMAKNGNTKFNKAKVEAVTEKFYNHCLDNPTHKAIETMGKFDK